MDDVSLEWQHYTYYWSSFADQQDRIGITHHWEEGVQKVMEWLHIC